MLNSNVKHFQLKNEVVDAKVEELFQGFEEIQQLILTQRQVRYGEIIQGRVIRVTENYIFMDLGQKTDGYILTSELSPKQLKELTKETTLSVMVDDYDEKNSLVVLSHKKAEREENWLKIINNYKEGSEITGRIIRKISNGFLVDVGIIGFLPLSQLLDKRDDSFNPNDEFDFEILKIDEEKRNIILSRKKLVERNKREHRQTILGNLQENDICEGIVKNITNYGAFIDLGGIDGLLHITDISWNRINSPKDILELNQRVQVKILKIDQEKQRLSLGLKQLTSNPWKEVEKKYKVGTKLKATISEISHQRISVTLDTGVESIIDLKDFDMDTLKVGEKINVKIDHINPKTKKIDLSLVP